MYLFQLASVTRPVHTARYVIHTAGSVPVDTESEGDNAISAPLGTTTSLIVAVSNNER